MHILPAPYRGFVVYDLRLTAAVEADVFNACPFCESRLQRQALPPSREVTASLAHRGLIPIYHGTDGYRCECCSWWAIRERWSLYEMEYASYDFLIAGIVKRWDVDSLLPPLIESERQLQQAWCASDFFALPVLDQRQWLERALSNCLPLAEIRYLGDACEVSRQAGIFSLRNAADEYWLVVRSSTSGWIMVDAVQSVNGYRQTENGDLTVLIYCARQRRQTPSGRKTNHRYYWVRLPNDALFKLDADCNSAPDWDVLSQIPNLYDDPLAAPLSLLPTCY